MNGTMDKITDLETAMAIVVGGLPAERLQDPVFMNSLEEHLLGRIIQIMVGMISVEEGEALVVAMDENPDSIPDLIKEILRKNPDIENEIVVEVSHLNRLLIR
jgi:hypothetical protein